MVLGVLAVIGLGAGLLAGAYGVRSSYDQVKYHNKRNQLHTSNVDTTSVHEIIRFAELDKQGLPRDGGRVAADMVRSQAYTTEADATAMERAYNSKLIMDARVNAHSAADDLIRLDNSIKKKIQEEIDNFNVDDMIAGKYSLGNDWRVEKVYNVSAYHTETSAKTFEIYQRVREIPGMAYRFPYPPKVTSINGRPTVIWHVRVPDPQHKYYAKQFVKAAYRSCYCNLGPINKVFYEKVPEDIRKREGDPNLPYWLWTLEEKYRNNGVLERALAEHPDCFGYKRRYR